ncbi:MAG: TetR/AcrR family transcriptional regulator [Sulfurifustaceae bacterium]
MIQKARAVRQVDKLERRREILDAAERLFLAKPEGLASMDELAVAAGVAKGTLYLYFPSKEEVLLALHERGAHELFDAIDREIAAKGSRFSLDDLSALARRLIIESPIYLPLMTLVIGFIGRSIPVEEVVRFHQSIHERVARSGVGLERVFGLPAGDGWRLLKYSHAFVVGLWQLSGCGRVVAEHVQAREPNVAHVMEHAEIQRALETLWKGVLTPVRSRAAVSPGRQKVKKTRKKVRK